LHRSIDEARFNTFEDPSKVSREGRKAAFGEDNNGRTYGLDYKNLVENAGFTAKIDAYVKNQKTTLWGGTGLTVKRISIL